MLRRQKAGATSSAHLDDQLIEQLRVAPLLAEVRCHPFRSYQALKWTWFMDVMLCNLLATFCGDEAIVLRRMDQTFGDVSLHSAVIMQILIIMRLNASIRLSL